MRYNIDIDSYQLWCDQNGYSKPFTEWSRFNKDRFNQWCIENKKHTEITKLRKDSSGHRSIDPVIVREFAEKIINYIDTEQPLALDMYEYEGGIFVESANIGDIEERVKEYTHRLYENYVSGRFNSIQQYVRMNNDHRYDSIFDVNTGEVIKQKIKSKIPE